MAAIPAHIATIFGVKPARGTREAEGWRMESVTRDIATVHHLFSPAFACVLDGLMVFDSRSFRAHCFFVRAGELRVCQSGHWRTLVSGDIFCAFGWLPLTLQGSSDTETLVVSVPGWWALQRLIDQFQVLPDLYVGSTYFAAPIIATLAQSLLQMPEGDDVTASQALKMIADLMRTALAACADMGSAMPRAKGRMGEILWFIVQNLDNPNLTAQDAAASLRCSVRTIYKTCAAYGTSFSASVTEIRLVTAQYQLLRTDERVSQIAYSVGFSTISHFSRLFRARFGVPATMMRQASVPQALHLDVAGPNER